MPFGYVIENDQPLSHSHNAEGVKLAFESYATGNYSAQQVADILNETGYRTTGNWGSNIFTVDTVVPMLKNVAYLGYVKYKGELYAGLHPPLISQELFDKVTEIRGQRAKRTKHSTATQRIYIFSGLVRCSRCELTLRGKSARKNIYYRHLTHFRGQTCEIPDKNLNAPKLELQWLSIIQNIEFIKNWEQELNYIVNNNAYQEEILAQRVIIQEKMKRLMHIYQDLLISRDEYQTELKLYQNQLSALALPSFVHLNRVWQSLTQLQVENDANQQKAFSNDLVKTVFVDVETEEIVSIQPQPVFRLIVEKFCRGIEIEVYE